MVLFAEIENTGRGDRLCVGGGGVGRMGVGTARGMKHSIWGMLNLRFEKYPKGFI